ncbi:MAG: histidine kinase dimerization/phospho-acceptor domain-containing protein, partial [Candidatus Hydrothermarchaeales archaeon]
MILQLILPFGILFGILLPLLLYYIVIRIDLFFDEEIYERMYVPIIWGFISLLLHNLYHISELFYPSELLIAFSQLSSLVITFYLVAVVANNTVSSLVLQGVAERLGREVEKKTAELRESEQKLKEYSEQLEQKVEERTKELREAYEELKKLDNVKSDIISNVSHELRTPITIAKSAIEMAMEGGDEKERNELLEMGREALSKQNRIVEDLIEVASMEKRTFRLNLESLELGDIIAMAKGEMKPRASENEIEIKTSIQEDL